MIKQGERPQGLRAIWCGLPWADEHDPDDVANQGRPMGMALYQMTAFRYGYGYLGFLTRGSHAVNL